MANLDTKDYVLSNKFEIQGIQTSDLHPESKLLVEDSSSGERYILEYFVNEELILYRVSYRDSEKLLRFLQKFPRPVQPPKTMVKPLELNSIPSFLQYIKVEKQPSQKVPRPVLDLLKVTFFKPKTPASDRNLSKVLDEVDAKQYLKDRYYTFIYSSELKMSHFVKNTLSKVKLLCKNKSSGSTEATIFYQRLLEETALSFTAFDMKYENLSTKLIKEEDNYEKLRQSLITQQWDISDHEELSQMKDALAKLNCIHKLRELKLQIIICLELLTFTTLDKNFINFESRYKKKLTQKAFLYSSNLIGRKRKTKTKKPKHEKSVPVDLCDTLDIWVDKLCITETILGINSSPTHPTELKIDTYIKTKLLRAASESSSPGFHKQVLLPFYSRKVPNAVNFVSNKMKGTSFNKKITENNNNKKETSHSQRKNSATVTPSYSISVRKRRSSSKLSDLLQGQPVNTLLQRTKSDLNLLEKRSTPVSDTPVERTSSSFYKAKSQMNDVENSGNQNGATLHRKHSELYDVDDHNSVFVNGKSVKLARLSSSVSSFQRVGKKQLDSSQALKAISSVRKASQVQVEETPKAKSNNIDVIESPQTAQIVNSPLMQFASTRTSPYDKLQTETQKIVDEREKGSTAPVRRVLFPTSP
ncbi:hypothetical protein ACO0QE_003430 [Hanseniaspora vineae]